MNEKFKKYTIKLYIFISQNYIKKIIKIILNFSQKLFQFFSKI